MRILVVANLYPSERAPAFGTFVAAHVDALRRAGQEVDVVALTNPEVHTRIVRKYVALFFRATGRALSQRLRGRRYAVVEAHIAIPTGIVAIPVALLGGSRLVVYAHGSDVTRIGPRSRLTRAMSRLILGRADLVVANSAFTRDRVMALSTTRRPVAVISPGVAMPDGIDDAAPREGVLFVGRLSGEKGVGDLIRATAALAEPRPSLTIVGDGPERSALEQLAADTRVAAAFPGAIRPGDLSAWYDRAEVVVMPSTVAEGLGLVALEGMAHGAIVVATRVGGLAEVVVDGVNGVLVEPGDSSSLAKGIERAMTIASSEARAAMVREARATAQGHSLERSTTETIEAYRALTASAR